MQRSGRSGGAAMPGFHAGAIDVFKKMVTKRYDQKSRIWSFKNTEHDSVVQALSVLSNVTIRTDMTGFVASTSFAADRVELDATSGVWTIFPANQPKPQFQNPAAGVGAAAPVPAHDAVATHAAANAATTAKVIPSSMPSPCTLTGDAVIAGEAAAGVLATVSCDDEDDDDDGLDGLDLDALEAAAGAGSGEAASAVVDAEVCDQGVTSLREGTPSLARRRRANKMRRQNASVFANSGTGAEEGAESGVGERIVIADSDDDADTMSRTVTNAVEAGETVRKRWPARAEEVGEARGTHE
eukprot:CAMPEP_0179475040 /NCGR_PEP_ID=MMETSP0799-20121207/54344_1 /TAXON_ID=46947 /ORGANISM="Geminigera cryophila, Strain CCMP2564" /LENGTH=297 /DNA_ID=CAMNT_0021284401 /DNA_START=85 /DNA_END=975 /DNA_ORIENTATION=-